MTQSTFNLEAAATQRALCIRRANEHKSHGLFCVLLAAVVTVDKISETDSLPWLAAKFLAKSQSQGTLIIDYTLLTLVVAGLASSISAMVYEKKIEKLDQHISLISTFR